MSWLFTFKSSTHNQLHTNCSFVHMLCLILMQPSQVAKLTKFAILAKILRHLFELDYLLKKLSRCHLSCQTGDFLTDLVGFMWSMVSCQYTLSPILADVQFPSEENKALPRKNSSHSKEGVWDPASRFSLEVFQVHVFN